MCLPELQKPVDELPVSDEELNDENEMDNDTDQSSDNESSSDSNIGKFVWNSSVILQDDLPVIYLVINNLI